MSMDLLRLARRLERAQALQNDRFNHASGGASLPLGGGFAHFRGAAHPLNQALGLTEPVDEAGLLAVEAFLGAPTVLELSPAADPGLWPLLAARGYRLQMFQLLWIRDLDPPLAVPDADIRPTRDGDIYTRVVAAGFQERDDWAGLDPAWGAPLGLPDAWAFLASVDGEPAGGGMLGLVEGVALLSGASVLPRFRGRGLQKALIAARLAFARDRGCDIACASTAPGTASQRSYEVCGFRVAYPKVEMARG